MYQVILYYSCAYLYNILIKRNVATDEGNHSPSHIWHWQKEKIGVALQTWIWVRVELWPDSFLGCGVWTEFSGSGLKSHSGKLSVAISKNPSVVNIICVRTFCYTNVITSTKFRLKWTLQLTKAIAEMKYGSEQKGEVQHFKPSKHSTLIQHWYMLKWRRVIGQHDIRIDLTSICQRSFIDKIQCWNNVDLDWL